MIGRHYLLKLIFSGGDFNFQTRLIDIRAVAWDDFPASFKIIPVIEKLTLVVEKIFRQCVNLKMFVYRSVLQLLLCNSTTHLFDLLSIYRLYSASPSTEYNIKMMKILNIYIDVSHLKCMREAPQSSL